MIRPGPRIVLATLLLFVAAAFALRLASVQRRPMHTDEAVNALLLADMLEGKPFRYDPQDKHGPSLPYATYPVVCALGVTRLAQLDEWHLRLVPSLFGAALLMVPLLFARDLGGPASALGAALWLGCGAPFVYYGGYGIHETLFVFFTLLGLAAGVRWLRDGRDRWALLTGASAGLLVATKETAVLTFASVAASITVITLVRRPKRPARLGRALALAGGIALPIVFLAYTGLGRRPGDVVDLFAGATRFTVRAAGEGHEKPWATYLAWIGAPNVRSLPWFGWTLLGACAAALFFTRRTWRERPLPLFLAGFSLAGLILYSAIPYKTPWLALNFLAPAALLGGIGVSSLAARSRFSAIVASVAIIGLLAVETSRLCLRFPVETGNPWAYSPTVPDAPRLQARLQAYAPAPSQVPVQVVGTDIWPLPWYLRRFPAARYAAEIPKELDAPVVIADFAASDAVAARLGDDYDRFVHGLRPEVPATVFLRHAKPSAAP